MCTRLCGVCVHGSRGDSGGKAGPRDVQQGRSTEEQVRPCRCSAWGARGLGAGQMGRAPEKDRGEPCGPHGEAGECQEPRWRAPEHLQSPGGRDAAPKTSAPAPTPKARIHGALENRGISGDPHPASLKQSIALLMIPDVLPKVTVSFSGSFPPAVDHVCPSRQGVPRAVKSGPPTRTGHPAARAGRSPGAGPPSETGGRGLPGTPRAQPVWSRVRRGTRASVLGLRQQTAGVPAPAWGGTGPKARHPGQPWGEDLNSNTREEQVDV